MEVVLFIFVVGFICFAVWRHQEGEVLVTKNPRSLLNGDRTAHHNLGWLCTNCGRHHSMWTGKCRCGEVSFNNQGET